MSERANALHVTSDRQLAELIEHTSTLDDATARRRCTAREKLGDGTVGAVAQHTADNYQRIAQFATGRNRPAGAHTPRGHGRHRIRRLLRALRPSPSQDEHRPGSHDDNYTADSLDRGALHDQLAATRATLQRLAELTDGKLDTIPPKDSFRFSDGSRSLEQVLAALLKHQQHQLDALKQALR